MKTLRKLALALGACGAVLASPAFADTFPGVRFVADLKGDANGDPDGHGTAYVWADQTRNRICAQVTVSHIVLPASSYMHVRTWGGPLVFMTAATSSGCMITDENTRAMIAAMLMGRYLMFVGVSNEQYGRALVGNLHRG